MELNNRTRTRMNKDIRLLSDGTQIMRKEVWEDYLSESFIEKLEKKISRPLTAPVFDEKTHSLIVAVEGDWTLEIPMSSVHRYSFVGEYFTLLVIAREFSGEFLFHLIYGDTKIEGSTFSINRIKKVCSSIMEEKDFTEIDKEFFDDDENFFDWN